MIGLCYTFAHSWLLRYNCILSFIYLSKKRQIHQGAVKLLSWGIKTVTLGCVGTLKNLRRTVVASFCGSIALSNWCAGISSTKKETRYTFFPKISMNIMIILLWSNENLMARQSHSNHTCTYPFCGSSSEYLVSSHTGRTPIDRLAHTEPPPVCLPAHDGQLPYKGSTCQNKNM